MKLSKAILPKLARVASTSPEDPPARRPMPSTQRVCRPAESLSIGRLIPGRNGGLIGGCATPSREHPREGQWWLGLPVVGRPIRKSTAARRVRDEGKPRRADPRDEVERASVEALRGGIPYPTGLEFVHVVGTSRCDPEHKLWKRYEQRLNDASETGRERAAMEVSDNASDEDYHAAVEQFTREDFDRDPQAEVWTQTAIDCARGFQRRAGGRRTETDSRIANRARRAAEAERVDLTSAEYLDTLRPQSRAAYFRRVYKMTGDQTALARARDIERDIRSRAPKKKR